MTVPLESSVAWQMLRDIVPCHLYADTVRSLGMVPPGPDVSEREHSESHARLDTVGGILDDVICAADTSAEVLTRLSLLDNDIDSDLAPNLYEVTEQMCRAACVSVIAQLVAAGKIKVVL